MLGHPAYLDSVMLADLHQLFTRGVNESEVLVLLLTRSLLTRCARRSFATVVSQIASEWLTLRVSWPRPWCLLEICHASEKQKPIVLLALEGQRFSFDDAFALLSDLQNNLPPLNPSAIAELCVHLKKGQTLSKVQEAVRGALEMGRAAGVSHLNING
jgi:hypothetical protein